MDNRRNKEKLNSDIVADVVAALIWILIILGAILVAFLMTISETFLNICAVCGGIIFILIMIAFLISYIKDCR